MKRLTDFLATLPSTNARIAVTLCCVFGTAIRYWSSGSWVPDAGWLTFLAAMSGIDVAQFMAKRSTHIPPSENGPAGPSSGESSP